MPRRAMLRPPDRVAFATYVPPITSCLCFKTAYRPNRKLTNHGNLVSDETGDATLKATTIKIAGSGRGCPCSKCNMARSRLTSEDWDANFHQSNGTFCVARGG